MQGWPRSTHRIHNVHLYPQFLHIPPNAARYELHPRASPKNENFYDSEEAVNNSADIHRTRKQIAYRVSERRRQTPPNAPSSIRPTNFFPRSPSPGQGRPTTVLSPSRNTTGPVNTMPSASLIPADPTEVTWTGEVRRRRACSRGLSGGPGRAEDG